SSSASAASNLLPSSLSSSSTSSGAGRMMSSRGGTFSSLAAAGREVLGQSFVFNYGVKTLGVTLTAQGITNKQVLGRASFLDPYSFIFRSFFVLYFYFLLISIPP